MRIRSGLAILVLGFVGCSNDSVSSVDMGTVADMGTVRDTSVSNDATSTGVSLVTCPETPTAVYEAGYEIGFGTVGNPTFVVGDVVRVDNVDIFPHTVTQRTAPDGEPVAVTGGFDFDLPANGSICIQFTETGTYPYFCEFHTSMRGVFTVTD